VSDAALAPKKPVPDVKRGGFSEWGLPALRVAAVAGIAFLALGTLRDIGTGGPGRPATGRPMTPTCRATSRRCRPRCPAMSRRSRSATINRQSTDKVQRRCLVIFPGTLGALGAPVQVQADEP
jgi:hypothetical protein